MSASNQMFSNGYSWGNNQRLYSDQVEYQSLVFMPANGAGGAGDYFTARMQFRTIGSLILLNIETTVPPTSPTATPNWSSFTTNQQVDVRFRPLLGKLMPCAVLSNGLINAAEFIIGNDGICELRNTQGAANFPTDTFIFGVNANYSKTSNIIT